MAQQITWNKVNNFIYGEVGNRLDSLREKEEFQNSAKEIRNAYITETGSLRVMKQWSSVDLAVPENIIKVLETKFNFFVAIMPNNISLIDRNTRAVLSTLKPSVVFDEHYNFSIFDNNNLGAVKNIRDENNVKHSGQEFYQFSEDGKTFKATTFMDDIKPPIANREQVIIDIHVVQRELYTKSSDPSTGALEIGERKIVTRIVDSLRDPEITLKDGVMTIKNVAGSVKRIYKDAISVFIPSTETKAPFTGNIDGDDIEYGDLIVNFHGGFPDPLLWNKYELSPSAEKTDTKFPNMRYFETFLNKATGDSTGLTDTAVMYNGTIVDLKDNISAISVFQDRLVLCSEDTIYFSKVHDYDNFTTFINTDSAFFIKPNPITNRQPTILGSYSSRGLFIVTDSGIYSIGYNAIITPSNTTVSAITDMPSTNKIAMIDYNFYFIGEDGFVYVIQEQTQSTNNRLYQYILEKYDTTPDINRISVVRLDKKHRLLATTSTDVAYLYIGIENDTFSRVSFDLPNDGNLIGVGNSIVDGKKIHDYTNKNYEYASVHIHQPSLFTPNSGTLLNDLNSVVQVASCYLINQKTPDTNGDNTVSQIKYVIINGKKTSNLGDIKGNLSSAYSIKTTFPINEGFEYEIQTTQNVGLVEIQALEYAYKIGGRY